MSDKILTVLEVATLLRVADKTVYQQGELPAFKVRGQWRFLRTDIHPDIDEWMAAQIGRTAKSKLARRLPQRRKAAGK